MQSYHWAWLANHPDRSERWLRNMLADGFQVHHIDGDHSNDEPSNLALIEGQDHLRLHELDGLAVWLKRKLERRLASLSDDDALGRWCYELRSRPMLWRDVYRIVEGLEPPRSGHCPTVRKAAQRHADRHDKPWPLWSDPNLARLSADDVMVERQHGMAMGLILTDGPARFASALPAPA